MNFQTVAAVFRSAAAFVAHNKMVFALIATAGISTMPAPGSQVNWLTLYTWLFDWLHQFPNIKRPIPPGEPGQPKQ